MAQEVASCSRRAALSAAVLSAAALLPAGPALAVQGLTAGRVPGKSSSPAEAGVWLGEQGQAPVVKEA